MMPNTLEARYLNILRCVLAANTTESIETQLIAAYDLGREMLREAIPPDEVVAIHQQAVLALAQENPTLTLLKAAPRINKPLMETSMAYGLGFREQIQQRYQMLLDARLAQSTKLEALGVMAAGIAHDFNNILGSILGFAELVCDDTPPASIADHNLHQIINASLRARDIVHRMLIFAQQAQEQPQRLDIIQNTKDLLTLLSDSYRQMIDIRIHIRLTSAEIMIAPGQWQQVVMNLCINAIEALDSIHGYIEVNLDPVPQKEHWVCLTVADNGQGMTPEVKARIFDPFFTTKSEIRGIGLGLSVVYSIVSQLGGHIEVESIVVGEHHGSQFHVYLPLAVTEHSD